MESFIVRIYRQETNSEKMTGVAIQISENEEYRFSNIFELYNILTNKRNSTSYYIGKHDSKPLAE